MNKLVCILILGFSNMAFASDQDCLDALRSRAAAVHLQDWNQMIRAANKTILECKDFSTKKATNTYKVDIIVATYKLGQTTKALKLANECINNFYNTPTCHYWRAVCYRDLGNKAQFVESKRNAFKVANFVIEQATESLSSSSNKIEKMDLESDIEVSKVIIENLDQLL